MERRENQDLTRNTLLSGILMILTAFISTDINPKHHHNAYKSFTGFLRAMGNCQGILFLTTNRIVRSRIRPREMKSVWLQVVLHWCRLETRRRGICGRVHGADGELPMS